MKGENGKNILLGVLIVGLIGMTVAYAALSTTLNITGTANVAATTWNVHFADWTKATTNNTLGKASNTATATNATQALTTNTTSISDFTITLNQPGDNVKYTFKIKNDGTIPAKLSSFQKHIKLSTASGNGSTADSAEGITYTVTCSPANTPNTQTIAAGSYASCELQVIYNDLTNSNTNQAGKDQTLTQAAKTINIDATWVYVQQ